MQTEEIKLPADTQFGLSGVYAITHVASGKRYIGSASNGFQKRWVIHLHQLRKGKHHSVLMQRAWDKYGQTAFVFRVMEVTLPEHAVACEQVMIDYYRSADPAFGYNISPTAGSPRGVKRSAETRKANGDRKKAYYEENPEERNRVGELFRAYYSNPEARNAVGKRMKAYYSDPEIRKANADRLKLFYKNPEARKVQSDNQKAYNAAHPEAIAATGKKLKEYWSAPEARLEASNRAKEFRAANPEAAKQVVKRLKAYWENPEARLAQSERVKAFEADPVRKAEKLAKRRATIIRRKREKDSLSK